MSLFSTANKSAVYTDEPIWQDQSIAPANVNANSLALAERQSEILYNASLNALQEYCNAGYSRLALTNCADLAMLEARCLADAPGGKDEYRAILRAHGYLAVSRMFDGDW